MKALKRFVYARIYRATRCWRHGPNPVDSEELMKDPGAHFLGTDFLAVPTFRYFKVWPWDRQRPRWLPAYRTPNYAPSLANFSFPERRAINYEWPEEGYGGGRGDVIQVVSCKRGARVYDARFSSHGRQQSSDVWCLVEVPWAHRHPRRDISLAAHSLRQPWRDQAHLGLGAGHLAGISRRLI